MIILGVDPGASGAIAEMVNGKVVRTIKTDSSYRDLCNWMSVVLAEIKEGDHGDIHAYIERVSASPGAGVSGMFRFGQSYGALQMLLTAHHVPFDLVQPAKWQVALGCARPKVAKGEKKESQTEHKNRTKSRAQELFPEIRMTHAIADALLIAEFGRRLRAGELQQKG